MDHNFVRIHKTLRVTRHGRGDGLWEIADIARPAEGAESAPAKRGPYKKRDQ